MKNNKKGLYVALPLVILIYGLIVYKIFFLKKSDLQKETYSTEKAELLDKDSEIDTFSIKANYSDPFLGKIVSDAQPVRKEKKNDVVKVKATLLSWPSISYSGTIKNQKSNKQLAMMQINGKENMLKPGDVADGVQLVKIYKDSIEVVFQKERKFFKK